MASWREYEVIALIHASQMSAERHRCMEELLTITGVKQRYTGISKNTPPVKKTCIYSCIAV